MEVSDKRAVLMDKNYLKLKRSLSSNHLSGFLLELIEENSDAACTELEAHLRISLERLRALPTIWPSKILLAATMLQNIPAVRVMIEVCPYMCTKESKSRPISLLHYYMSNERADCHTEIIQALIRAGTLNNTVDSVLGHPLHLADATQVMLLAEHGARYDLAGAASGTTTLNHVFHNLSNRILKQNTTLSDIFEKFCCLIAIGDRNFSSISDENRLLIDLYLLLHRRSLVADVIVQSGYTCKPQNFEQLSRVVWNITTYINDFRLRHPTNDQLSLDRIAVNAVASAMRPNALMGANSKKLPPGYRSDKLTLGVTRQKVQEGALKTGVTLRKDVLWARYRLIMEFVQDFTPISGTHTLFSIVSFRTWPRTLAKMIFPNPEV